MSANVLRALGRERPAERARALDAGEIKAEEREWQGQLAKARAAQAEAEEAEWRALRERAVVSSSLARAPARIDAQPSPEEREWEELIASAKARSSGDGLSAAQPVRARPGARPVTVVVWP